MKEKKDPFPFQKEFFVNLMVCLPTVYEILKLCGMVCHSHKQFNNLQLKSLLKVRDLFLLECNECVPH